MLFIKKKCIYRWQIFQARFPYNFQFLCFTENKIMKQILKITFEKTITDGDAYLYTHQIMLTVSYICILFSLRSCLTIISIPIERSLLQQRGIWWQEDFSSVKMWPEALNAIITADPLERYLQSRQVCKKDLKADIL